MLEFRKLARWRGKIKKNGIRKLKMLGWFNTLLLVRVWWTHIETYNCYSWTSRSSFQIHRRKGIDVAEDFCLCFEENSRSFDHNLSHFDRDVNCLFGLRLKLTCCVQWRCSSTRGCFSWRRSFQLNWAGFDDALIDRSTSRHLLVLELERGLFQRNDLTRGAHEKRANCKVQLIFERRLECFKLLWCTHSGINSLNFTNTTAPWADTSH